MKTRYFDKGINIILPLIISGLMVGLLAGPSIADTETGTGEKITWLVRYDGKTLPQDQGWSAVGPLACNARIVGGALQVKNDTAAGNGYFRAEWDPCPSGEVVVEVRARVEYVYRKEGTGRRSNRPHIQGWPSCLLVSDGRHQEGLVLSPERISTFLDRVVMMDARSEFHTYRLVIRGNDMSIYVDGELKILGEGAFWKQAESRQAFVQFGSNSKLLADRPDWAYMMGESYWEYVKLGTRKVKEKPEPSKLRITISEPWDIPSLPPENPYRRPYEHITHNTRPTLHDIGQGKLLMTVCQGPDAVFEPYGILRSDDEGRTWEPLEKMQYRTFAPHSMIRLPDNDILGFSVWTVKYEREEGVYIGMSYRFNHQTGNFTMSENMVRIPEVMEVLVIYRDIFHLGNDELLASVFGRKRPGRWRTYLVKSLDGGSIWNYFSTVAEGPEPSFVRLSEKEMTAIIRDGGRKPMMQTWSQDGGKTWSQPVTLEEASVCPDLVYMSNGVLACSYGRPGSNLMFSLDKGKTWSYHHVITEEHGFNYTSIHEVRPGRLLYVHDAPRLRALYIDVERMD
jgi:hypothetical protein